MPGSKKKYCANGHLSSVSDNFDKEMMVDHGLDKLPQFVRKVISLSTIFLQKSSAYNNLVAMAAMVVCNYIGPLDFHGVVKVHNLILGTVVSIIT
jgi:hypothetical protein